MKHGFIQDYNMIQQEEEDTDALYLNQELLVEIKTLIEDINDSKLHHLRECATLIHDINKGV